MVQPLIERLTKSAVVAVIRKMGKDQLSNVVAALLDGGITSVEVTLNTPGSLDMIRTLAQDSRVLVAAGTVMDPVSAVNAINAGARLIVSPHLNRGVLAAAKRCGIAAIPGAMTPTEIVNAWEAGADMVKVFPAGVLGAKYFHELRGPIDDVPLMATGGLDEGNIREFIRNGVNAVGVGGALVRASDLEQHDWAAIAGRARRLIAAVAEALRS